MDTRFSLSTPATATRAVARRDTASTEASAWLQSAEAGAHEGSLHVGGTARQHDLDQLERDFLSALCQDPAQA